jgi:hypothetical protein
MAKVALSTVTHQILEEIGQEGPITAIVTGADIYPGSVVTQTGETLGTASIDIPGAADESVLGIVGLLSRWDIGTAYTAGMSVPVYRKGSGTKAWSHIQAAEADAKQSTPLNHTAASADGYVIAGELLNEYVGIVHKDVDADATDDVPVLIHLV